MLKYYKKLQWIKRPTILLVLLIFASNEVLSQTAYTDFAHKSLYTQNIGMYTLGGWAIANIATGAYGWATFSNDKQYFSQMNLMWNVVNLSIAGFALYNNSQLDFLNMTTDELLSNHLKTEKVLLINSALDVGYIGTGFLLRYLSKSANKYPDLLRGYGNSLILQGGFLLVFDLVLYQVLKTQRLDMLNNISLYASHDYIGMRFIIGL